MTRRRLRPDELDLWQQIARSTDPLNKRRSGFTRQKSEPAKAPASHPAPRPEIAPFTMGNKTRSTNQTAPVPPSTAERLRSEPLGMDAKAFTRMKRGKLTPDTRIDLHGMTLDRAHQELVRFILTAQTRGHRLVLVITGKGQREDPYDPMPRRRGVLKAQVPQWVRLPPVAQAVLQITEAHRSHGGEGAYYVYLRKHR